MKIYLFLFGPLLLLVGSHDAKATGSYHDAPIDEEQLIENLIQQGRFSNGRAPPSDELELELEPPEELSAQDQTEAEIEDENEAPKVKPEKKGELEFVTFVAPDPHPAARQVDRPVVQVKRAQAQTDQDLSQMGNTVFIAVTTVCTAAAMFGLVVAGVFWYKLHKQHVAAAESEYPQYGVIGPSKEKKTKKQQATARGDESMAYGAQLHHYQQTKQKIISMEQSATDPREQDSDESEAEGEEGDYSVYECPGLAPTGDIEVSNPMFENANGKRGSGDSDTKPPETD